jgi:hypothetical protein
MIYSAAGALLAAVVAVTAWHRSRGVRGYYDGTIYAMDARTHRRYCAISVAFAAYFAVAYALQWTAAGIVALAAYATIAVFYAASFLRGASDDVE